MCQKNSEKVIDWAYELVIWFEDNVKEGFIDETIAEEFDEYITRLYDIFVEH